MASDPSIGREQLLPFSYQMQDRVLCYSAEGEVDFEEALGILKEGIGRARELALEQGRRVPVLMDIRESREQRSSDELRQIAEAIGDAKDALDSRLAIVVLAPHLYGLSRMFAVFADWAGVEVRIFSEPEKATEWLLA